MAATDQEKYPSLGYPPISIPRWGIPNCNGLFVVHDVPAGDPIVAQAVLVTGAMLAWLYTSYGVRLIVRAWVIGKSSSNCPTRKLKVSLGSPKEFNRLFTFR